MDNLSFSYTLRELLSSRGISQKWLSTEAKTTEATISRYLAGKNQPEINIVANIAQALNVSMDYLCGLSDSSVPKEQLGEEILLLIRAYKRADDRDKRTIFMILERYMTPDEKLNSVSVEFSEARDSRTG